MNMTNLTEHKCAGKCTEYKEEQCKHCLIQQIEKREFELGVASDDAYVKTISNTDFVEGDSVVFIDAFMPEHIMTVHRVQGDGILLDGNHKFALIHLLRHASTVELNANRRLSMTVQSLGEVS